MKILILGGTGEARELAARLVAQGHQVTTSLAGRTTSPLLPHGELRVGKALRFPIRPLHSVCRQARRNQGVFMSGFHAAAFASRAAMRPAIQRSTSDAFHALARSPSFTGCGKSPAAIRR